MSPSQKLQNLGADPIAKSALVHPSMMRAWRANANLTVGRESPDGGYRRYDLADAARLRLMKLLTGQFTFNAAAAAMITNFAHRHLLLLAMHEYHALDLPGEPILADNYVMLVDRADGTLPPAVHLRSQLAEIERRREAVLEIDLNLVVERARESLQIVVDRAKEDRRRSRGGGATDLEAAEV